MRRLFTLALLCTGFLAVPAQGKALKSVWGPLKLPNDRSAGPLYRSMGLDVLQVAALWSSLEPTRPANPRDFQDPAYRWSTQLDEAVALGKKYGFSIAVLVKDTPAWANGGKDGRWVPNDAHDFENFMFAMSKRYPGVRRWMIWGEPSRRDNFQPIHVNDPTAPREYAKLLDAAYVGLHRANRRNVVIGGMTFTTGDVVPRDWVRWMRLPNGKPPRLDEYGHNPFSTRIPDLRQKPYSDGNYDFSDLDTLHSQLCRVYRKAYKRWRKHCPGIWVSEFTIQADHGSNDFNFYVSAKDQGNWIKAAFTQANRTSYIKDVGWLGLLDEPLAPYNRTTGLLTYKLRKKPAYYAFKRAP